MRSSGAAARQSHEAASRDGVKVGGWGEPTMRCFVGCIGRPRVGAADAADKELQQQLADKKVELEVECVPTRVFEQDIVALQASQVAAR
ncbi:hypothetical protein PsorP6_007921 [Peronosclerospora sorghi]|uniref:Uncharacterized protein n=1 Tax=Peronosclerospora sorghi TaxID=230839 RepID=A0ACC0W9Y7_9STRA|nr:hypothetical protein PsorP6_007921 [Peronosclerospora sorghi]